MRSGPPKPARCCKATSTGSMNRFSPNRSRGQDSVLSNLDIIFTSTQYTLLHYITLHCIALHYITLHCIALQNITLHYVTYINQYRHGKINIMNTRTYVYKRKYIYIDTYIKWIMISYYTDTPMQIHAHTHTLITHHITLRYVTLDYVHYAFV